MSSVTFSGGRNAACGFHTLGRAALLPPQSLPAVWLGIASRGGGIISVTIPPPPPQKKVCEP
jgi:hypothetical protein